MAKNCQKFLTASEAALLAGVTHRALNVWCRRFPDLAVRVVGRWRIRPDALDRLLAGDLPTARVIPPGGVR